MNKPKCMWYSEGECLKGLPDTKCEVIGCVARSEDAFIYKEDFARLLEETFDNTKTFVNSKIKAKALKRFPVQEMFFSSVFGRATVDKNYYQREGYIAGYTQAQDEIIKKAWEWLTDQEGERLFSDFEKHMKE